MITQNTLVRDYLIRVDVYNSLPADRQQAIAALVTEFKGLGYIDARLIGVDQVRRQSDNERQRLQAIRSRVFAIETEIKLLMRSDAEILEDQQKEQERNKKKRIEQLANCINNLELYCPKQIHSKRNNVTKQEYQRLKTEYNELNPTM